MQLKTARLIIREITQDDASFILELLNQSAYMAMIRDSGVRDLTQAKVFIHDYYTSSYQRHGYSLYALYDLNLNALVGIAGFVKRDQFDVPDLGFAIHESFAGKGYILEACRALLSYGKDHLDFMRVAAITTEENCASKHILEKLNFKFIKTIQLPNVAKDFLYYERDN